MLIASVRNPEYGIYVLSMVECIHVAVFAILPTLFLNTNSLSQSASSCTGRCHSIREAIQHCMLQICFLAYTSLFSIKSSVLQLNTAQKVFL